MQNVSIHDRHVSEYPTLNLQEYAAGDTIFSEGNRGEISKSVARRQALAMAARVLSPIASRVGSSNTSMRFSSAA